MSFDAPSISPGVPEKVREDCNRDFFKKNQFVSFMFNGLQAGCLCDDDGAVRDLRGW
jgi:hypothetical protein